MGFSSSESPRVPPLQGASDALKMTTSATTFEDEGTQTDFYSGTDDLLTFQATSGFEPEAGWTATDSGSGFESSGSSESVIERLSRRVTGLILLRPDTSRCDQSTQTVKDALVSQTEKLAYDIVFFCTGKRSSDPGDDVTKCLRFSVQKMLEKHSITFNGMMSRLHINQSCDFQEGFNAMADELFIQEKVSWGKIIALYAFGARLAQYCNRNGMEDRVAEIASNLAQFAVKKLTPFLKDHGGWATLCEAFPIQSDYESKIWKSLIIAGFGLTTIAAIVAMQR